MTSRRQVLLDAAIRVIGERGIHGLTHRSLDAAAGVPAGSTSNHFRTRKALLDAVVVRFAERERANWDELASRACPTTPQELARLMATAAIDLTTAHRTLTLTRYAILVEAGIDPSLREQLTTTGRGVDAWFMNWLRLAGSTDPHRDAPILANHWTGIVLHELANPAPEFDPLPQISGLVTALFSPHATEVTA